MQTTEEKVDTTKALDASLGNTKSSGTESGEHDTSSRSGNDAHADDADIRPIYCDNRDLSSSELRIHDQLAMETVLLQSGSKSRQQLKSDSLPHAHAQTTKTYYKHQDSRIKKAQELKTKTFANSDIKDNSLETKLRGRLLESFQEDAKYEHVGQDTRSQDGKDDQDKQERFRDLRNQRQ
ncbi:hypothetical protein Tco_0826719 [Tanacetum coccineum]